jgi:hypothetical protein
MRASGFPLSLKGSTCFEFAYGNYGFSLGVFRFVMSDSTAIRENQGIPTLRYALQRWSCLRRLRR